MIKKISDKSIKALERLEDSYRLVYIVVMSVPLILAIDNLFLIENQLTGIQTLKDTSGIGFTDFLIFLVFMITYIRFFLGDLRYLDLKYLQRQSDPSYIERYSPRSRFVELYSLIVHAIFFYLLAASITQFEVFYKLFTLILIINSAWLFFVHLMTDKENRKRLENQSGLKWAINNTLTSLFLIIFYLYYTNFSDGICLYIFVLAAGINTFFDYLSTWKMYFPKIREELIDQTTV